MKYETGDEARENKIKMSLESMRFANKWKCDYIEMRLYRNTLISK